MPTALDSNILIYILDDASPFSQAAQTLLKRLEHEASEVYISTMARTEILHQPYLLSNVVGEQAQQMLDSFSFLTYIAVSIDIANIAAKLITKAGAKLKNVDSIHLASALQSGATDFWTNDKALAKMSVDGLSIKLLSDVH